LQCTIYMKIYQGKNPHFKNCTISPLFWGVVFAPDSYRHIHLAQEGTRSTWRGCGCSDCADRQ